MQNFITLGQPLLGEKYVAEKERKKNKNKNSGQAATQHMHSAWTNLIYNIHLAPCQACLTGYFKKQTNRYNMNYLMIGKGCCNFLYSSLTAPPPSQYPIAFVANLQN
jgi:hypothetical protein